MEQVEPGLPQIDYIYFAGGEPLLQPEQYALLERLIALGRTDVALSYNSNMSVMSFKDRSILDLWSHFPNVEVEASVDAAGELGALIRKGFDWPVFAANVNLLRGRCPHVRIRFGVTVSIMNIMALPELFMALGQDCGATFADYNLHSLQDPVCYRSQVLPRHLKDEAARRLRNFMASTLAGPSRNEDVVRVFQSQIQGLLNYMNAKDLSGQLPRLAGVTARLDALREESGASRFPGISA
jgi:hypothetical protein